jgi:serine/threonine protein kinase/Tol biopolymer transport system component/tetratricopeptide (TPR) repeat protein
MSKEREKHIEAIYHLALDKKTGKERSAYLDSACADDNDLRAYVESLLKAHDKAGDFLESPILDSGVTLDESPISEGPGTIIGRYKLLEKIGEGGMAVVYMAEQTEPICRKVALKIIKLGMDTKSVIARFEAERQALAIMDHPNIAKVLDAGATETGRPYFVMELVTGVSITEYCDKNNLSTKDRLTLFIQVCNAVQHAHQKGIIHRDIKPTNIIVTLGDGQPMPKVIDFGIAKAINQKLTEKTLFTRYAHIIGTPAYMSPEQAELSELDIDTRTDIYSLGVLLYELLTGTTPFGEEELRKAGYIEMQRIIREQEPTKPSTKLSTLGKTLTDIAKHRSATPDILRKTIRGDLDWIVMKSLEKDRSRRYETANTLALDIRHHLEHEPVMARGPSTTYRMHKFLRRHRSQTIAVLAIAIVAVVVVAILSMWNNDRLQLAEAESFRHRGILSQAREQYARAEREAALETLKPILGSKHVGPEAQLLQAGILIDNRRPDEAVTILSNLLNERPEIAGAAHSLLTRILWESESPNAEKLKEIGEHRRKAEALLPETAEAYFLRAMTAVTIKEQLASLDKALQLDPAHYESRRLRAFTYYASRKYDRLKDDALVMAILRPREPLGYSLRAIACRELGRYQEAIADYDRALALTLEGDPQYIDLSIQRCETLLQMGDYNRLISDAESCLKLSPDKPVFQYYIFSALTALGEYEKADTVFREIVGRSHTSRNEFRQWCSKYVFDTLDAGRSWHPKDHEPTGAAFLPMVEAEETYLELSAKARRLTTDGFSARWSPDGKKLAFSLGVHGYSGVALYDPATKETELLIVPGKDPRWSPDGTYIAFVRDCQLLRLEELAKIDNDRQQRPVEDEEVWLMKSDGTEPRLLARGSWPSWGSDSEHIYYQSRVNNLLFSISIVDQNPEPKKIMKCSSSLVSVSPDNQRVSYFESGKLKIKNLASKKTIAECPVPSMSWGVTGWSSTRNEVCLGGSNPSREKIGLWIYNIDQNELLSVLNGQIGNACWSSRGTEMALSIDLPYFEIWTADLNPNVSTIDSLGPGQTLDEHFQEMATLYTRRIENDPLSAENYLQRAVQYHHLREKTKGRVDMRQYYTILSQGLSSDFTLGMQQKPRRVINGPFGYQAIFTVEEWENDIQVPRIALGRKGRCNMKTFKIPILPTRGLAMSLLGLCLLSGLSASPAYADFIFGEPVNLEPAINSPREDCAPCLSSDSLELYFHSEEPDGEIRVVRRATPGDEWGPSSNLGPTVNSPSYDGGPSISSDGLSLYFGSDRPGGYGWGDLWVTTRATTDDDWGTPVNLGPSINTGGAFGASISADELELYFHSDRPGGYGALDIWVTTRATVNDNWGTPVNLGPALNTFAQDNWPGISPDGLLLFFGSNRPGGAGSWDLYMARRATTRDPWGPPMNLGPMVNSTAWEVGPKVSPDGSMLYFHSPRPGGLGGCDIWQASIEPVVDFNVDGIVDAADMCIMIEHWLTDYSLCDIGPMPWGDGVVDVQDLIVLAEHLFEEIPPAEEDE